MEKRKKLKRRKNLKDNIPLKEKKSSKKKVIYFERYIKIECPFCKKMITLLDSKRPEELFCDMCLNGYALKNYSLKERKQR